eukprot:142740-Rhodomonas_salina.1
MGHHCAPDQRGTTRVNASVHSVVFHRNWELKRLDGTNTLKGSVNLSTVLLWERTVHINAVPVQPDL